MKRASWIVSGIVLTILVVSSGSALVVVNVPTGDLDDNTTQNEPTIAVWGSVIVIGWNDVTQLAGPGVSWTGYGYSTDGGATWSDAGFLAPVAGGKNLGDPVLDVDRSGTFYFATMAQDWMSRNFIGVARSTATSPAVTFGTPVLIAGADSSVIQDKPWLAVDVTGGQFDGRVYVCWKDRSDDTIRFVRSTGTTPLAFGPSQVLSSGTLVHGCTIAAAAAGEVYVTWLAGWGTPNQALHIRKSLDGGDTFGTAVTVASVPRSGHNAQCRVNAPAGVNQVLNGNIRVPDFPAIAVDHSGSLFNGAVYIAFSADPDGAGPDEADVFITRSPADPALPAAGDPGVTWSTPVSINKAPAAVRNADTTNNDNWLPAIAVSPANGTIAVIFYDRRMDTTAADGDPANFKIDLFKAISTDGGATWLNKRITQASFGVPPLLPNFNPITTDCYMGDYNSIAAVGTDFFLTWGDNTNTVISANFPMGRPDPDVAYASEGGLCDLFPYLPKRCAVLPPINLFQDGLILQFDELDRVWVDPIDRQCWFKWPCPGCEPGPAGLCPSFYNVIFDFKQAGLDPDVVRIQFFDSNGKEIARERKIDGRKVFSFRPKRFKEGGVGENLFFLFALGSKGKLKTKYVVPVQLQLSDKPMIGTTGG